MKKYLIILLLLSFINSFSQNAEWSDLVRKSNHGSNPNTFQLIIDNTQSSFIQRGNEKIKNISLENQTGYELVIKADFQMIYIFLINDDKDDYYSFELSDNYTFTDLAEGTYQILSPKFDLDIENRDWLTIFYYEFELTKNDTLSIKYEDANKSKTFRLKQRDYTPLYISTIEFLFYYEELEWGLAVSRLELNHDVSILKEEFTFNYNELPNENYEKEWVVRGKQPINKGDFYSLNGEFINSDTTSIIENNPENYGHANFSYCFPSGVVSTEPKVSFHPGSHGYDDDEQYELPLEISIYQDTSANIDLRWSKIWHIVELNNYSKKDLSSIKIRLSNDRIIGYTSNESFADPIVLSDNENITFGLAPTYWFGKFENTHDTIKIEHTWGAYSGTQLFLSQTNDVLPHYPLIIEISNKDSVLIQKEIISPDYLAFPYLGLIKDSLTFPLMSDWYHIDITNDKGIIGSHETTTKATIEFDLRNEDKNPPFMKQFQIVSDDKLANSLTNEEINKIRFRIEDDRNLNYVQLLFKQEDTSVWEEIILEKNGKLFIGELPVLESGYYDLKIDASDEFQNNLTVTMTPAFYYDNLTDIKVNTSEIKEYKLYANYPNPFNPSTVINYSIAKQGQVELKVFDVLGREIATLVNKEQQAGSYEVQFSAQGGSAYGGTLTSGVYFYQLRVYPTQGVGQGFVESKKMILLR